MGMFLWRFRWLGVAAAAYFAFFDGGNRQPRAPTADGTYQTFCYNPGQFAMTFDEGPSQYTKEVTAVLAANQVKATFHIVTKYLTNVAVLTNVQEAAKAGHVIGLRWPTDVNPIAISDETFLKVLRTESNNIFNAIGKYPKFLRLPAGKYDNRVVKLAQEQGFIVTMWNFDPEDYKTDVKAADVITRLNSEFAQVSRGQGRYITLFHDIYPVFTDKAFLQTIVTAIKDQGYNFVTLGECLNEKNPYREKNGNDSGAQPLPPSAASTMSPSFMVPAFATLMALVL
jgi:peptidoglycan/xylan/chitin deacetylase (PgdA/CDA1 family)